MNAYLSSALSSFWVILTLIHSFASTTTPIASIRNGTVAGLHNAHYNQDFFLGIPFAKAPVDELRFKNPQSLDTRFNGTYQATEYAPECIGYGGDSAPYPQAEDCLYLNVIRPSGYEVQHLPVAVWIHGGGFVQGGTQDLRYNLSFIVSNSVDMGKPIMAVSIAYRLSAWGFLNSQELVQSGDTNMGLRDQRLALHWLKENIESFGGDPRKVTIWGESAGAVSVGFHLTAFDGRDDCLFRAGIMQSGNPINVNSFHDLTTYQPMYDSLVQQTGCKTAGALACLRSVSSDKLSAVINSSFPTVWQPIVDGDIIARWTSGQLADGSFVKVPVISGANTDEGTTFSPHGIDNTSTFITQLTSEQSSLPLPADLAEQAADIYRNVPEYRIPSDETTKGLVFPPFMGRQYQRGAAFFGDAIMVAPRRATCEAWARMGVAAYSYRFNTLPAGLTGFTGVTHFQEVAFVFGNVDGVGYHTQGVTNPFSRKPQTYTDLAKRMCRSWVSFVHDLDPNNSGLEQGTEWPAYSVAQPQNIVWDAHGRHQAYQESDAFRYQGIKWINNNVVGFKR